MHHLVSLHVSYVPSCSECPAGTYSDSVSSSPCQSCPDNSEATQTGLSECPCVQNYYRVPDEGAGEACTRELWTVCADCYKFEHTSITPEQCAHEFSTGITTDGSHSWGPTKQCTL